MSSSASHSPFGKLATVHPELAEHSAKSLRLDSLMGFVSNAVMTGFTTRIALQIVVGVIKDATGYPPQGDNTLGKLVDAVGHLSDWQLSATLVALATIVIWAIARQFRRLESLATLVALVLATVAVLVLGVHVEQVATLPRSHVAEQLLEEADYSGARQHLESDGLTARERDVARLLAAGQSNREIAHTLVITEGTVEVHVKHILSKLGFKSRAQLAAWAKQRNNANNSASA